MVVLRGDKMIGLLTEKSSITLNKTTNEKIERIISIVAQANKDHRKPLKSEIIRYAIYSLIDGILYPDRDNPLQDIKSNMATFREDLRYRDFEIIRR